MTEPNGFYYMRARYYDPQVGRFISEDPIGLDGGDVNLYVYAGNNPIMGVDPWGMCMQNDWVSTILGTTGAISSLIQFALTYTPGMQVAGAAAGFVNIGINLSSSGWSYYQYTRGKISGGQLSLNLGLAGSNIIGGFVGNQNVIAYIVPKLGVANVMNTAYGLAKNLNIPSVQPAQADVAYTGFW